MLVFMDGKEEVVLPPTLADGPLSNGLKDSFLGDEHYSRSLYTMNTKQKSDMIRIH